MSVFMVLNIGLTKMRNIGSANNAVQRVFSGRKRGYLVSDVPEKYIGFHYYPVKVKETLTPKPQATNQSA